MELPLPFKTFRIVRAHFLRELDELSETDLLAIPEGREDNILWNAGHLLCSLSRLTYVRSGHPLPIPKEYLDLFGKGTSATAWTSAPNIAEVMDRFKAMQGEIERHFKEGHFKAYDSLEILPGQTIDSVEEAVNFHCFHEGLHTGVVITLKDMLSRAAHT